MKTTAQTNLFDKLSIVLFAGGGGADTGISCMTGRPVDIAINHDIDAIRMHKTNHPYTQHFQEDVFAVEPATVCEGRKVGVLWASPDCTHFSKAKGGKPVKKEIRGLSWVVLKWALAVGPDVMFMENVEEIQTWGPCVMTKNGLQPDPARKGETYQGFISMLTTGIESGHPALLEACEFLHIAIDGPEAQRLVKGLGYDFGSNTLCAADFGVPTIRKRWFAVFRRDGKPIRFPDATHSKDGKGGLKKWMSAAEIIDWSLQCPSIFESKAEIKDKYGLSAVRPLAENTQKRCIRGVDKFTIKSVKPFIVPTGYGERKGHAPRVHSIDVPVPTAVSTTKHNLCRPVMAPFTMTNTSNAVGTDAREPVNTARTGGGCGQMIVTPSLMAIGQTGGGDRISNAESPINTQVSKAETCLIAPSLIQYHQEQAENVRGQDITDPVMTIDTANRYGLVSAQLTEYFGNGHPLSVAEPMHTITGRDREALTLAHISKFYKTGIGQDCAEPLHTVTQSMGHFGLIYVTVEHYPTEADLRYWPQIRALLNKHCEYSLADDEVLLLWINKTAYFIADIGLRMLTPRELFNAMGFPPDYIIDRDYTGKEYPKSEQVARCGNAVCPPVAGALVKANLKEYALPVYIVTMAELMKAVGA